jgi:thiazole synthase
MVVDRDGVLIAGRIFDSRLIASTGRYKDGLETRAAIEASGASIVTVAVRQVNISGQHESLLDFIDADRYFLLPNTAGCYTAEGAVRTAHLARDVGMSDWIKVEVIGDKGRLDLAGTLLATKLLVKDGFTVLAHTSDDIVFAERLIDVGAAAIMPLGAPIGSSLGLQNRTSLQIMRDMIHEVPLIVDAGIVTASDATLAMEMGFDAVLMNIAIASSGDPISMAHAMKFAVIAGRVAFLSESAPMRSRATVGSFSDGKSRFLM